MAEFNKAQLEMATVMVATKLWAPQLKGKGIKISCDDMVSVNVLNSGKSGNPVLQDCMREIMYYAAMYDFKIVARYIKSKNNIIPDPLSRWEQGEAISDNFKLLQQEWI